MKNQYLIWAHMQRRHSLMTPPLRKDLDELLGHSMKVTQAMIEVACMREWFGTAQGMIEFRRCLVQGLDIKSSQLLQIPHFSDKEVDLCQKASPPVTTLSEFLALEPDERKKLSQLGDTELLDVEAFCGHIGQTLIKAHIGVEDESEIIVGDVATVKVQMCRKHLARDEALGPVSAPLFPGAKFEEWWLFLVDSGAKAGFLLRNLKLFPATRIQWPTRVSLLTPVQPIQPDRHQHTPAKPEALSPQPLRNPKALKP